jgi:hypothetical protein
MNDNEHTRQSIESIELSGEDAMRLCSEQAAKLSGEQRLANALIATSYEIMSDFRDIVIGEWSVQEVSDARVRARNAASEQMRYAQWLRTAPTATEVATFAAAMENAG